MERSEPLDGLRGLAVLLVLLSHASNAGHDVLPGLDARGVGRAGVFLFFVLSSFLLTTQVLVRLDGGRPVQWGRFALRRFLRVVPAFAFCMAVHVALGVFSPRVALEHLLLVRAEAHFWTVPVEVLFYLVLPALGLVVVRIPGPARRAAALALVAVACRVLVPPDFPAKAPEFRPDVLPFLPIFLTGSALAAGLPAIQGAARATRALGWCAVVALVALAPAVVESLLDRPVPHTRFHLWFETHAVLWAAVVAACVVPAGGLLRRLASLRPLRALGTVSYSVYLFHGLVLAWFDGRVAAHLPGWVVGPMFLVVAVAVGAVSFALVERPLLARSRSRAGETVRAVREGGAVTAREPASAAVPPTSRSRRTE